MRMGIYVVFDAKADAVMGAPFAERSDETAARAYSDMASRKDSLIGTHPEDFDLIRVAYVDLSTRKVEMVEQLIVSGEQWKRLTLVREAEGAA